LEVGHRCGPSGFIRDGKELATRQASGTVLNHLFVAIQRCWAAPPI
jgi:hypothetical protein